MLTVRKSQCCVKRARLNLASTIKGLCFSEAEARKIVKGFSRVFGWKREKRA
jgi:hypothetical protein